ncbi:hypothetical protein GCM10010885_21910 [Alicyclobacillus cellulosilyticus]|uniref:Fumarylacetoacetase-like C-terminal domain-containing protein n=2 Tax=Alicyclobacillus cellulosilyticus TaxID=1003997 RepID=A0A917KG91_9BACL|nr:hypothetical protein GCM10010885_21910 [Alicyclobacillus cellulosilyticus]
MIRTIRFLHPVTRTPHLGWLRGDEVVSLTSAVPEWTDPLAPWRALRALGIAAEAGLAKVAERALRVRWQDLVDGRLLLPPVAAEEVWAAGVTYERSRVARNAETKLQESVYDRVYEAERPELFFKATGRRVVPPLAPLGLRQDSRWMVPEPELAVAITASGEIVGWTLGNDLSSRDIEGENPLYLPQAKVFARSCSYGPALLWNTGAQDPRSWQMEMVIWRQGQAVYRGAVPIRQMRRSAEELIAYLLRDNPILDGTVLFTGTGIVPPDDFTLQPGDVVDITVDEIGTLRNPIVAGGVKNCSLHDGQ